MICGETFLVFPGNKTTQCCSRKCSFLNRRKKVNAVCLNCGEDFSVFPSNIKLGGGKFCSRKCASLSSIKKIKVKCLICQKEFYSWPRHIKEGGGKFCSVKCSGKGRRKEIIKQCLVCRKNISITPLRAEKGQCKFCSRKCFAQWKQENQGGKNNPNWRGGVTPENHKIRTSIEYRLWREAVFARDGWTCQECGKKGDMHAHHIRAFSTYPMFRFAIDNGITLCFKCHRKANAEQMKGNNYNDRKAQKKQVEALYPVRIIET